MKTVLIAMLLTLAPLAVQAQQRQSREAERAAYQARRDSLEREIVTKFIHQLTRDLRLDDNQRAQTEQVLRESGLRRRELVNASRTLRSRMYHAARESGTADAEFARMLNEFEVLRQREHDLWNQEQSELARIYSPRQRVQFVLAWTRFQELLREIISDRLREGRQER